MYNHFCMFADESAAIAALGSHGQQTPDGWQWDASRVIAGQQVILSRGVWDYSDPANPVEIAAEQTLPGFFVTVTLPIVHAAILDLPGGACRIVGNVDTGVLVYTAPGLDPDMIATAIIEPMPSGAAYHLKTS